MTVRTLLMRAVSICTIAVPISFATTAIARAEHPRPSLATSPSLATIQKSLPDTTSLNDKVVYVDFWASWCAPCRRSFPWMQAMYSKYHTKGLEIVAVCVDKDHKQALKFLSGHEVDFAVVFDSTGNLAKGYDLKIMPTSFIYERDGRLVSHTEGFREDEVERLESTLVKLIDPEASK